MSKTVVLAYSGGLDTSAIVPWLKEQHDCEVVAVVGDVGQGAHELEGIEERATRSGAKACVVLDLKREFVEDYVFPTLAAGAIYETKYLLGTAVARPVLAGVQARLAVEIGADALCHGCTGKGNDQVRFEAAYAAIAPGLEVIAPWRQWSMTSRQELLDYLAARGIACSASPEKIYSRDANLWHVSHEGGDLEDPAVPPGDDVWMTTASPAAAPDEPRDVTIGFVAGRPCTLDGSAYEPVELVTTLNAIAGTHGVGRIDIVENRLVGMKSRGCYETPGGTVLTEALRSLEELVLDRATLRHRQHLGRELADLLYDGKWFTPVREAILAGVASIASALTGTVTVRLYKGTATPIARTAEQSLYSERFATFGDDDVYDQKDAAGFIRLVTLPSRIAAASKAAAAAAKTPADDAPAAVPSGVIEVPELKVAV